MNADRVKELTVTEGVGAVTLAGSVTGYQTFAEIVPDGQGCYYVIEPADATGQWEEGWGVYSASGNSLSRTASLVLHGSAGVGALVTFSAGVKHVFITLPALGLEVTIPFTVTHAQTLALSASGVTLLPAPGAAYFWDFRHAVFLFTRVAAYAGGSNLFVNYTHHGAIPSLPIGAAFLTSASATPVCHVNEDSSGDPYSVAQCVNKPLILSAAGAEFTGGDVGNSLRGYLQAILWPTGF